ncbi:uncharacterized protein LY89DRAFT_789496 [Mollisia scopiformis]|uniref:Uncharacterized protein n=1 Tax=Mollisia scopiformis TaxID=149040 RepID=A0A132B604_MOLSC|nr:uncharacterized protein LY89DRAFT_789496 [Mollisia scopiformis]KUJ07832.1 hypothetical protein LY89DRAFT_789496 [Mollisia scopiformis]
MKTPLPTTTISHDEIVAIITKFYTFLTTYPFLPATAIKTPPSEGWPEEYCDIWRKMGKSEEVVDLLARLPYIDDDNWVWYHDTMPINYTKPLNLRRIKEHYEEKRYVFEPSGVALPPHVFSLTHGKLYGKWVLLDIKARTITELGVLGGVQPAEATEEAKVGGDAWSMYPTRPIKEFFDACQDKMSGKSLVASRNYIRC